MEISLGRADKFFKERKKEKMRNQRFEEEKQNNGFSPYYGFAAVAIGLLISICVLLPNSFMFFLVLLAYLITAGGLMSLSKLNKKMKISSILAFAIVGIYTVLFVAALIATSEADEGEKIFTDSLVFQSLQLLLTGGLIISFEGIFIKALGESAEKYGHTELTKKAATLFGVLIVSGLVYYGICLYDVFEDMKAWVYIVVSLYWGIVQFAVMSLAYTSFDKFDKNADKIRKYKII